MAKKMWDYIIIYAWMIWGIVSELIHGRYCVVGVVGCSFKEFATKLMVERVPFVVHTTSGETVIVAHGAPDGRMQVGKMEIGGYDDLIAALNLQSGNYLLLSCHNGCRQDFQANGISITRMPFTCTPYPAVGWVWGGKLYSLSSVWAQRAQDRALPYIIEELKKQAQANTVVQ